ncbi:MAG: LURP-one-related family protein [Streptococcaceae bacterium]|nr:LURP-one-related family protein [Streptococcaceae bacterium]
MSELLIQSKIFSLGGESWVTDASENEKYRVKGSFLKFPKEFVISDVHGAPRARVIHKMISIFPQFFLEIDGVQVAEISKKLSFFKPKYEINAEGVRVLGNIWDMSFEITRGAQVIGRIDKQWVSVRDKYRLEVFSEADELLILGIVLAINYVKQKESLEGNS